MKVTDEMVQRALDIFLATPTDNIAQIDAGMHKALTSVLTAAERTQVCGARWDNPELPEYPHRCVIRFGYHVQHACHCGSSLRVSDDEHVQIARGLHVVDNEASPSGSES